MTRILRLLLIAAIALPLWQPSAAQEVVPAQKDAINPSFLEILRQVNEEKMSNLNRNANIGNKDFQATPKVELEIKNFLLRKNVDADVVVKAPQASTQTVCDGTALNLNLPFCGTYFDYGTSSQMIYPADMLDDFLTVGDKITSLTFYVDGTYSQNIWGNLSKSNNYISTNLNNSDVILRIGETTDNTVTSEDQMTTNRAACTYVFGGKLGIGSNQTTLTITFNKPYKWNGSNLIVDFVVLASSASSNNWAYVAWFGEDNHENASYYDYYANSNATAPTSVQQSFLPKMNIGYLTLNDYDLSIDGNGDFGKVVVNQTGRATFVVTNTGKKPCTPVVTLSGDEAFTIKTNGYGELAPDESRYYLVTFAPTALQSYSATLTLTAEESMASAVNSTINLTGIGSETAELNVGEGEDQASLPVYLRYLNYANHGQVIYQASDLKLTKGTRIHKITFHSNNNLAAQNATGSSSPVTLKIGETTQSTYSSTTAFLSTEGFATTTVNNIFTGTKEVTFTFAEPYTYLGGNLVIDASCGAGGAATATSVLWLGANTSSNVGIIQYRTSNSNYNQPKNEYRQFHPMITIECVPAEIEGRTIVVKDPDSWGDISYDWYENGDTGTEKHTSSLDEIATNPDQMIAMLREIYTNKSIPGNMKRGFTETGFDDHDNNVLYTGVGELERTSTTSARYKDTFGWNVPADPNNPTNLTSGINSESFTLSNANGTFTYWYMDPEAYKPTEEGLTLLLVEIKDDFKGLSNVTIEATSGYAQLREYFEKVIKSVRVIKNAKRTGNGLESGTLFKINCEKMNMFYLLAKGQLAWFPNMKEYYNDALDVFRDPCYIYNSNYTDVDQYLDYGVDKIYQDYFFLGHMFEQFSPAIGNAEVSKSDIYQDMINMQSFGVIHDCPNVPLVQNGHHFMMYGVNDEVSDCQDVTDMMFFVPDYRMMEHLERGGSGNVGVTANDRSQDYFQYNPVIQPIMGLYVIRQKEITPTVEADEYYMLNLNWVSNLDDFLPSDQQEFELLEVVVNEETGEESYVPVYYKNAQGQYIDRDPSDPNAQVVDEANRVPIVLTMNPGKEKNYPNVYVKREQASKQVTYAIRGRDAADSEGKHFLSLQISNRQSYIIPGTDPTELVSLIELAHYSRYNPDNEENCYSNRFKMSNNVGGLTRDNMSAAQNTQNVFAFTRKTSSTDENPVTIATATVTNLTGNGGTITITMQHQDEMTEFPRAKNGSGYAGYHANPGDGTTWTVDFTYKTVNGKEYVDFGDFVLCDNFIADVKANEHPNQYIYEVEFNMVSTTEHNFTEAHGSAFHVPIYRTASKVNNAYTLQEVQGDKNHAIVVDDLTFSERVQYSSKTEILRYDVYRWPVGEPRYIVNTVGENDAEQDLPPHGIAGNQGEGYTVTMNDVDGDYYYNGGTVAVSSGTTWADFVDYYPASVAKSTEEANAYVYAPVVETFTVGKNMIGQARTDYNTYGGPQQVAPVGVLDVNTPVRQISGFSWLKGSDRYAYYTVELPIKTDVVPDGYKIYMVRAWRVIDTELLDEPLAAFANRKSGDYMFDEMLNVNEEGITEFLPQGGDGEYQPGQHMSLGGELIPNVKDENGNPVEVYRGTFGARKVRTQTGDNDGCLEELPMTFRVRLYFTPENTSKAGEFDKNFYVAEYTTDFTIQGGIPTGIVDVMNAKQVVSEKYYNPAGIESDTPFKGVNIVVTRYSDGSTSTVKVLK